MLTTGCRWRDVPRDMGCSGETARTRLAHWEQLGIWQRLHASILEELHRKKALALEVVVVDSPPVRAFGSGADSGPNLPHSREHWGNGRKKGVNYTLMTDGKSTPLAMVLTPANTSDQLCLLPVVDQYPQVKGVPGRPRQRRRTLHADAGCDSETACKNLRSRGITPHIRKRSSEHGSGLGKIRCVVERTNGWLGGLKRFRIRYDRHRTIIDAWNHLALAALCHAVLIR